MWYIFFLKAQMVNIFWMGYVLVIVKKMQTSAFLRPLPPSSQQTSAIGYPLPSKNCGRPLWTPPYIIYIDRRTFKLRLLQKWFRHIVFGLWGRCLALTTLHYLVLCPWSLEKLSTELGARPETKFHLH